MGELERGMPGEGLRAHHALIEVRDGEGSQAGLTPLFARQTALGSGTNRQGSRQVQRADHHEFGEGPD